MDAKACYRSHCGKSVSGYEGKCGGTMIDQLKTEKACMDAGGAWATAAEAKKFKKKKTEFSAAPARGPTPPSLARALERQLSRWRIPASASAFERRTSPSCSRPSGRRTGSSS